MEAPTWVWLDVKADARGMVVVDVKAEVTGVGEGRRDSCSKSLRLPPSLVLSGAPRSSGVHLEAFFFFLRVYLKVPTNSKLIGFCRLGSRSSSLEFWQGPLADMVASANVRGLD